MLGSKMLTTLGENPLDRLGDLNPQLLREIKGRLKWFSLLAAIGLSMLLQLLLLIRFTRSLPGPVLPQDLAVSTHPTFRWNSTTQLSPQPLQGRVPLDTPNREQVITSGLLVYDLNVPDPIRGDQALGRKARNEIQVGDRLIAIDGQPVILNPADIQAVDLTYALSKLATHVDHRLTGYVDGQTPSEQQKLIGETVELELYRPEQGRFTVTLPRVQVSHKYNRYCLIKADYNNCNVSVDKQSYRVNWSKWYADMFTVLSVLIVLPLTGGGVFMLVSNLAEEKRRGTLNFLQLSPRAPLTILGGKLLGVPICLYLAMGLAIPLQWFLGLKAGYSVGHLLGFDIIVITQTLICYLIALLFGLSVSHRVLPGLQPWLLAAGVTVFNWLVFVSINPWDLPQNTDSSNILL